MRYPLFAISALFIFMSNSSFSQIIGMNASMFYAHGAFNQNIDHDPVGLSFTYLHYIGETPWSVGAELGVAMYSNKEFKTLDNSNNEILIYEEDCFYNLHLQAQYLFVDEDLLEVFVEGRIGVTTFFSEQHAQDEDADFEPSYETHGTAFNLGIGGGLRLNLSGIFKGNPELSDRLWLDVAYTTHSGSKTHYRNAREENHVLSEASFRSLTNYDHLRIGVSVKIR